MAATFKPMPEGPTAGAQLAPKDSSTISKGGKTNSGGEASCNPSHGANAHVGTNELGALTESTE